MRGSEPDPHPLTAAVRRVRRRAARRWRAREPSRGAGAETRTPLARRPGATYDLRAHVGVILNAAAASATSPGLVLVATKLHVPDVRPGFVPRNALVARLADDHCRLALVCAPAGWGKSVLLTQWHAAQPQTPFAWVSLDPGDDEPVRFWNYVIAALRTVVPGFGGAVLAALPNAGPGLVEGVIPRLINELAMLEAPVVLVLDDYHL